MFKIKYESCMILLSRYSKRYTTLSSKEILLQEANQQTIHSSYIAQRQICVSRNKILQEDWADSSQPCILDRHKFKKGGSNCIEVQTSML